MELLKIMTSPVITLQPTATVAQARVLMVKHNLQHLVILDGKQLVGIVSDRDIHIPRITGQWNAVPWMEGLAVKWVMSSPVLSLSPTAEVSEAARMMRDRKIGCVPVVHEGDLVGIVTITDLLNVLDPGSGALLYPPQVHRVSDDPPREDQQEQSREAKKHETGE